MGVFWARARRAFVVLIANRMLVNLEELSRIVRVSATTLRRMIAEHADFPIRERGKNGVPYSFDTDEVTAWLKANAEKAEAAKRARAAELEAEQRRLFGDELPDDGAQGLSPRERKELYEAERLRRQLAEQSGELTRTRDVEAVLDAYNTAVVGRMMRIADDFAREVSLSREDRDRLVSLIEAALRDCADKLERKDAYRPAA